MDTKKFACPLFSIFTFCILVLFVPFLSMASVMPEAGGALDSEIAEIVQDSQAETELTALPEGDRGLAEADQPSVESGQEQEPVQDTQIEIPEDQMQLLAELARDLETRRAEIEETGITEFITVDEDSNQVYLVVAVFSVLGGLAALAFVNKWNVGV